MNEPDPGKFLDISVGSAEVRAHYHEFGPAEGIPVLFAHTGGAAVSAWMCWYRNLEAFGAAGYRVLAPDSLGFGETEAISGGPVRNSDFLLAFMDALELPQAHLIGNSGGALAVTTIAGEHPERTRSLIISGGEPRAATPAATHIVPRLGRTVRMDFVRTMLGKQEISLEDMRRATADFFCDSQHPEVEVVAQMRWEIIRRPGMRERELTGALAQVQGGRIATDDKLFQRISAPTFVLHGRDEPGFYAKGDRPALLAAAMRVMELVPRCDLTVLAGCGHWPQIEMAERYNDLCLSFLAHVEKHQPVPVEGAES